ncbi:hypothetical protein SprV_0702386800 [Sparganum proliferum]
MGHDLRVGVISPYRSHVFGDSRPEQSSSFSDVVALSATAPDPKVTERAREQRTTRDAALGNKFHKLPDPTSSRGGTLVHNLSSKELTKEQVQVLRHDASFNTAEAKPVKMIAAVESAVINQTEAAEETKNLIRHQVSFLLMTHKPREIVPKVERDALRELKADRDIVIVPADKGRSTVVLDRTDYLQKANNLLEDRQFYVPCEGNPVETLTREINAQLLALETSGAIRPTDRRMAGAQEKVNIGMGLH